VNPAPGRFFVLPGEPVAGLPYAVCQGITIDLFNNPVGYWLIFGELASLARNPAGFNASLFAVFKQLNARK
jgi:hypothetical protein